MRLFAVILILVVFTIPSWTQSNWEFFEMPYTIAGIKVVYEDTLENAMWVGGSIYENQTGNQLLLKWQDGVWTSYGYFNGFVSDIVRYNGQLIIGGFFETYQGEFCSNMAVLDGDFFVPFEGGSNSVVHQFRVLDGVLYACGFFTEIGGTEANKVAKYIDGTWLPVFNYPFIEADHVYDVSIYNQQVVVSGNFSNEESVNAEVAFYDEELQQWLPLGGGLSSISNMSGEMAVYKNELYLSGYILQDAGNVGNFIQKWNGTEWTEVGGSLWGIDYNPNANGQVWDMEVHNDLLYISGTFSYAGDIESKYLTIWDGEKYCSPGGDFPNIIHSFGFFQDTLYVAAQEVDGMEMDGLAKWIGGDYVEECSTVHLNENEFTSGINYFPNPTSGFITIESETVLQQNATVEVLNSIGQHILTATWPAGEKKIQIRTEHYANDLYFLSIKTETGLQNLKFVKE